MDGAFRSHMKEGSEKILAESHGKNLKSLRKKGKGNFK
jgi:hypothetical protein